MSEKLPKQILMNAWIIVLAAIPPMLDATMINLAIPSIAQDFSATLIVVQWGVTGYILASIISMPFVNWLLNRHNGKSVLLYGVVSFTLISLMVGCSWSINSFVAFRILQGLAAGIIPPTMTTLLVETSGKQYLGRIISIVTTPLLLGPILAPSLAGFLLTYLSWRWLFWLNLFLGCLSILLIHIYLPSYLINETSSKLDVLGLILIGLASVSGLYWLTQVNRLEEFMDFSMIKYGLVFFIALGLYIYYDFRLKHATILPLSLFQSIDFSLKSIAIFIANAIILGSMIAFPLYFTNLLNISIHQTAIFLASQGVGMIVTRPFIGVWIDQFGARRVFLVGVILALIGTFPFIFFHKLIADIWLFLCLLIRGLSFGAITISLTTDIYQEVPKYLLSAASVTVQLLENLGTAFGSALFSAIVAIDKSRFLCYQSIFIVMLIGFILLSFIGLILPKLTQRREVALSNKKI